MCMNVCLCERGHVCACVMHVCVGDIKKCENGCEMC